MEALEVSQPILPGTVSGPSCPFRGLAWLISNSIDNIGLVARFAQTLPAVTIYCGDTLIQQQPAGPNGNQCWDTNNPIAVAFVTNTFQPCATSGFLGYALLPGVFVLCDRGFGRGPNGADTNGSLRAQCLPGWSLDYYNILSGTILHEFLHIAGGGSGRHPLCMLVV